MHTKKICSLNVKWYWMLLLVYSVQVYGPLSPSMSWEGCDLHPSLWVHALSGRKQRSQRSSQCSPFCRLCKINSFCQEMPTSVLTEILLCNKFLFFSPNFSHIDLFRFPWYHDTPAWRCSMQGNQQLTAESRTMSAIAAMTVQRLWAAIWWATPAASWSAVCPPSSMMGHCVSVFDWHLVEPVAGLCDHAFFISMNQQEMSLNGTIGGCNSIFIEVISQHLRY